MGAGTAGSPEPPRTPAQALLAHGFTPVVARAFVRGPAAALVSATAAYRRTMRRRNVPDAFAFEVAVLADAETGAMVGGFEYGDVPGRVRVPSHLRYIAAHPGAYVTAHTHPPDYPITGHDLRAFLATPALRALVVIAGAKSWYIVSADPGVARPDPGLVAAAYEALWGTGTPARLAALARGAGFGTRAAASLAHHVLFTRVTAGFGLRYTRLHG